MKKIVQLALIMLLISSTNGYCWDWPWRSRTSTTPTQKNDAALARTQNERSNYGLFAWLRTKMTPAPPVGYIELKQAEDNENFVELPKNLEEDKYYKVVKQPISGKIFMKEVPLDDSQVERVTSVKTNVSRINEAYPARVFFTKNMKSSGQNVYVAGPESYKKRVERLESSSPLKTTYIEISKKPKAFSQHAQESFSKTQQAE